MRQLFCTTLILHHVSGAGPGASSATGTLCFQCRCTESQYVPHCSAIFLQVKSDATVAVWQSCHIYTLEHCCLQVQMQPARAKLLYERALALFPVTVYLWQQYVSYLQEQGTPASVVYSVYSRQELDADNISEFGGFLAPLRVSAPVILACMSAWFVPM